MDDRTNKPQKKTGRQGETPGPGIAQREGGEFARANACY
jgi:hypothetical protein